ncbi:DUF6443 domain-containing protein [Chryseolinea sp. T2]|uniref:DUF6443 domain-containing protein n=1 Tax=Chryseolinea sp. T2 TaxID=3129255 RepID=UPI003076B99A
MKWFQRLARPLALNISGELSTRRLRVFCTAALLCVAVIAANAQTIIYVKKGATGTGDGSTWINAYPELRTALTAAAALPGAKEVWVAQGEYKPTAGIDRTISFIIGPNVSLYGGFIGTETSKNDRDWRKNRTVLSGDLGKQFDYSDNSYHVLYNNNATSDLTVDGLVISYGNANWMNGSSSGDESGGGGFFCKAPGAQITVSNTLFENNRSIVGAGAMLWLENGDVGPRIVACEFNGNTAEGFGGALATNGNSEELSGTFINCTFSGNSVYNSTTTEIAGSVLFNLGFAKFINCTITSNRGTVLANGGKIEVENSIFWRNFKGTIENPEWLGPDDPNLPGALSIKNSIVQGGYGTSADNNIDSDPLFVRDPSIVGVYPRTSILPVAFTNPKYENQLEFNGARMWGLWPYVAFHDHTYNKTYMLGSTVQILDYNNLVDNKPTGTLYTQYSWPRTQRPERSYHAASNTIKLAILDNGILSIHRQTGAMSLYNPATGEPAGTSLKPNDLVVDDANNLLYTPVFSNTDNSFYGLLELNLTTQAKRWITASSSPVAISGGVANWNDDSYWGGFRLFLDGQANVLYLSTGNGLWWWNRTTNATGLYNTNGGIPVAPGNPQIPSNLATGVYVDNTENKVYIGTHAGLYVWNRSNNTSRVYNASNSKLIHNLINTIDKNDERHLLYVACEDGALLTINTETGEETLTSRDIGSPTHPQYMDVSAASAFYDEFDKKLWVSADHNTGGTWIADYNNLVPDYGDLRLQVTSPAIDKGNHAALPSFVTTDLFGLPRYVDYPTLAGSNSLDLGAYERIFEETDEPPTPLPSNLGLNYVLTYTAQREGIDAEALDSYATKDVNRNIQYVDGLGRPLQTIAIQGSPTKKDVIVPVEYDEFGREVRKYLPFTKENNGVYVPNTTIIGTSHQYIGDAASFYAGALDPTIDADTRPFSETVFEPSPLNRPLQDYGPGESWSAAQNNRPVSHQYLTNIHNASLTATEGERIIVWKLDAQGMPAPASVPVAGYVEAGGYYSSNQLSIKVTIDEEGHAVREYTNKQGQVILKKVQAVAGANPPLNNKDSWACTYYIYDDLDNLVFVLQPEGYKQYLELLQN